MINTTNFKTRTIFIEKQNPSTINKGLWGIGLDIGYSGVKSFSPNAVSCFPSYARKSQGVKIGFGEEDNTDIQYRDGKTGEVWNVGASAQQMITSDDTNDSDRVLFGRNRYYAPMFKVIAETGLAFSMMKNQYGSPENREIFIETGLPPKYLSGDSPFLLDILAGEHVFEVKVGNGSWKRYDFNIPKENIGIMPQPMGTFTSISTGKDGKQIPEAAIYSKSNMLIGDAGFGTFDTFDIRNRTINSYETLDTLGMKIIFKETTKKIMEKYGVDIGVSELQKYLLEGSVVQFDVKNMRSAKKPFADILEEANRKICFEGIEMLKTMYNNLIDFDYFVIAGGTGAAWSDIIRKHFAEMQTLTIISGNQNDDLPYIFSNSRGYYMYLLNRLRRM